MLNLNLDCGKLNGSVVTILMQINNKKGLL